MSPFPLLFANAWRRFARVDGVARNTDPRSTLILAAVIFGTPGMLLSFYMSFPALERDTFVWIDPRPVLNLFALSSGLLVALATLLQWDSLLPGPIDNAVLGPLPVKPRQVFTAQAAALAALLAVLTLVVNAPATILCPILDSPPQAHLSFMIGMALRQVAGVTVTACLGFSSVVALQALIVCCGGPRGLKTIGPSAHLGAVVVVLAALLLSPSLLTLGGHARRLASPLNLAGWAAIMLLAAGVLYILAAQRAFQPALHSKSHRGLSPPAWVWGHSPRIAAVARFAALTLARSRRQRFIVGAWFALGAAVVLQSCLSIAGQIGTYKIADILRVALAAPLLLALFFATGLRQSFMVPIELPANWIFRLCGDDSARDLLDGGRRLMFAYLAVILMPATGLAFLLWPPYLALTQLLLLAAVGAAWIQLLTWNQRKIPFTCSYQPGGVNLKYVWPVYAFAFVVAAYSLAGWEQWLLENRASLAVVLSVMGAALAWSEYRRHTQPVPECMFDDVREPAVLTLLS